MITSESNRRLRIAYLTELNPLDKSAWSCSLYHIGKALQHHCGDVSYIGPLFLPKSPLLSRIRAKSSLMLLKKRFLGHMSLSTARHYGKVATQKLAGQMFDVIVATASEAAIAYLKTEIPIVLVGDATWVQLLDYLPKYTQLSSRSIREIHIIEQHVFKKVKASIMSSEWAVRSTIKDCGANPEHVYFVPFGANFDTIPAREIAAARKLTGTCRLLFMSVDWWRKGGDIAYETLVKLEEMGIEAELIVCGCMPPVSMTHPRMTVIPYLDKNNPQQQQQLEQIFITSDFLFLPTRADCAPNVFCEANAFGLPVITSDTGGISSIIRNGENGYILPLGARGDDYADLVANIYHDKRHYLHLVQSSQAAFEERLNWDVWGRRVHEILLKECERVGLIATTTYSETRIEESMDSRQIGDLSL